MAFYFTVVFIFTIFFPCVHAWGDVGHGTVAYVAQHYLDGNGQAFLSQHLSSDSKGLELFNASTWPDKIKWKHPKTRPWHYIDIEDDPLSNSCGIAQLPETCETKGCIFSAIEDMTSRAQGNHASDERGDPFDQTAAIKFLIHLIGDLHMPLHVEGNGHGGNDIRVTFDNHDDKLHSIWDTDMPHKINNIKHKEKHNNEDKAAMAWAKRLVQSNQHRPTATVECQDISNPRKCIMEWATESNRLNCAVVFNRGIEYLTTQDLGGEYYEEAAPVIEEQIFKAGVRLAGWINALGRRRELPLVVQGD